MTVYEIIGGVVLLVVAIAIIVVTLLQHTHGQGLAGAIGGNMQGANSTRLSPADQMLAKVTRVAGVVFFVVATAACVLSSRAVFCVRAPCAAARGEKARLLAARPPEAAGGTQRDVKERSYVTDTE